jgi:hypothetical protein
MLKVQLRDSARRDDTITDVMYLPFEPREGKQLRLRRAGETVKFDRYLIVDLEYDIPRDNPGEAVMWVYVTLVR